MSPLDDPRRCGLYLRISKDWAGLGLGVERQREDGERLIAQRGWELHDVYIDNDISAAGRKRREDYLRLLTDIESGTVNAVVSRSIERLFKARREQLRFMELGQQHQFPVALTHGSDIDFSSAVGRGIADMQATWARVEMEQKSERHVSQIAQAARAGKPHTGRRAFGYQPDGLTLVDAEAELVRRLYDRWLTGEHMIDLANWLNGLGVTTPTGKAFTYRTVREILANPRNAALRGTRDVVNQRTGTRAQWHRIVGPAVWPEIVPEQTWRAAMERIQDPTRPGAHTGRNKQRYLLSGIARCGVELDDGAGGTTECGETLITGGFTRAGESHHQLKCPRARHLARRADYIEAYVEESLLHRFARRGAPPLGRRDVDQAPDVETLRSARIQTRARLDGLAADYAEGVLDRPQVRVAGERLRAELDDIDAQIAALGRVDVTAALRTAEDPYQVWDEQYPIPLRREVIRRVMTVTVLQGTAGRVGGVRFRPESVRIDWNQ